MNPDVLKDAANVLGVINTTQLVNDLDVDEKKLSYLKHNSDQKRRMLLVSESGNPSGFH